MSLKYLDISAQQCSNATNTGPSNLSIYFQKFEQSSTLLHYQGRKSHIFSTTFFIQQIHLYLVSTTPNV